MSRVMALVEIIGCVDINLYYCGLGVAGKGVPPPSRAAPVPGCWCS